MQTLTFIFLLKIYLSSSIYIADESKSTIRCLNEQVKIFVPFISNENGEFLDDISMKQVNIDDDTEIEVEYPDSVYVNIPIEGYGIILKLWKRLIHTSKREKVFEKDNTTYMEIYDDDCYYQGYVTDDRTTFAAVSLCNGLRGYMQTDKYQISVQPKEASVTGNNNAYHFARLCEKQSGSHPRDSIQIDRKKRQANKKFLEVLLAADTSVVKFVGKDVIENYLLSLMNIVNDVYKHNTLTPDIEVITVKLLLIDSRTVSIYIPKHGMKQEKTIVVRNDARQTVDRFCNWATIQAYNNRYHGGGHNFDVAVYLTRTNLGPAGYAPITGMCNPGRSCAVVKDDGFTSAFVVAHEIAHVFGLFHNGHGNRCSGQRYQTSVMAPTVQANLQQYWWTECSNNRMMEVLQTLTCLDNDPSKSLDPSQDPIGQMFSASQQCRYEFGETHELCRNFNGNFCPMLWCADRRRPHLCKTKRGPPLNGTKCGTERWCMGGSCVYYGNNKAVDGQWGGWTQWSNCSADCGIGLKQRTRNCDNPRPEYGGKDCTGITSEIDTCKAGDCTTYTDGRKLQCTVLDSLPIRRRSHTWLPYQAKNRKDYCVLTCISNRTKEIATFDDIPVDNGTPCSYDEPNNICVDGECIQVGCDGVRNSTVREDRCGVCDGDDSTCKEVSGVFKKKLPYTGRGREYAEVIVLPKGARHIAIKETATSPHFLALYDPVYGTYILNGNSRQGRSRNFVAKGAWFVYKNNYRHETLKSRGPLHRNLILLVHPRNKYSAASIKFNYTVPNDDYTYEQMLYEYRYDGWTECSVSCGIGSQQLIYYCYDKATGEKVDNDTKCQFLEKPETNPVKCERINCNAETFQWALLVSWSDCSSACGNDGYQYQEYRCERDVGNGNYEAVSFDLCNFVPAPNYTRPCNRIPCSDVKWIPTDEWSACSESCGTNGLKTKIYECVDSQSNHLSEENCKDLFKPEATEKCNRKACIKEWYRLESTNQWGECSASCGWEGLAIRVYECKKINSNDEVEVVGVDNCESYDGDKEMRPCNRKACSNGYYDWIKLSDWSECSSLCGETGIQYQEYGCFEISSAQDIHPMNASFCEGPDHSNVTRPCNRIPCYTFQWIPTSWGECTSICGDDGIQHRIYTCEKEYVNGSLEAVGDNFCNGIKHPNDSQECNRRPCFSYTWVMSPNWTECTATCGDDGVQFQKYSCFIHYVNDSMISASDNEDCKNLDTPLISRECNRIDCATYQWSNAFDWGSCTTTCGNDGMQTKIKVCEKVFSDGKIIPVSSSFCDHITDSIETRPCNREPCQMKFSYRLRYTNLTQCSTTCGSRGVQTYNVACQRLYENGDTEITDMSHCDGLYLPQHDIPCNRKACPASYVWKYSDWSTCSVSCGMGIQSRQVYCSDTSRTISNSLCSRSAPVNSKVCNQPPCPSSRTRCRDRIKICRRSASKRKCSYKGYKKMCCASCRRYNS